MAESTIITGQFVRISQTPASIGERLMALIIDYFLIGLYILSTITLLSKLSLPSGFSLFFFLCVVYLPILNRVCRNHTLHPFPYIIRFFYHMLFDLF